MNIRRIITFFSLTLFLILAGKTSWAQYSNIKQSDGSVYMQDVLREFDAYLEKNEQIPENAARVFIENELFPDGKILIRLENDYGKDYTPDEYDLNYRHCIDEMTEIMEKKRLERERITDQIDDANDPHRNLGWFVLIGGILLLILIAFVIILKKKSQSKKTLPIVPVVGPKSEEDLGIVVRRKTTSILRKQSLEDVVGNSDYLEIDTKEFCLDSAVRKIYLKNSCIKDIYNMYADDLRNPNNPKEDGCMVLGRWVFNSNENTYDVSLEDIVHPGDDAIFSEYELNFGGKIKLKVSERLKKLRRDSNLQYDLTCWVHSHPGLGVFFSNSDCNVQTQLKHPSHPNFLTALVVDILTPQQDLGIFTFRKDSSIISKADLRKMYSLEEWYKWALDSERNSFKQEDYYDTLSVAKAHTDQCSSIHLNNSVIIDMDMVSTFQNGELVKLIHGFANHKNDKTEFVAVKMSVTDSVPDNELIGAFVVAPHCSIPSIRKAISRYLSQISFVLVYSTSNGLLTTIPIINKDLSTDYSLYGEQLLDNLKIWTRRKR